MAKKAERRRQKAERRMMNAEAEERTGNGESAGIAERRIRGGE
jgi:hypothetical protein